MFVVALFQSRAEKIYARLICNSHYRWGRAIFRETKLFMLRKCIIKGTLKHFLSRRVFFSAVLLGSQHPWKVAFPRFHFGPGKDESDCNGRERETIKRLQIWFKVASNDEDVLIEENVNQFNNNVL